MGKVFAAGVWFSAGLRNSSFREAALATICVAMLSFAHTPDPVWAVGDPGTRFKALSDKRWATTAYARFRPGRTRSFDVAAAEMRIEETEAGSLDDLTDTHEAFERALTAPLAGWGMPQSHQMLGHATIQGGLDCRNEAATTRNPKAMRT